ncbi:hypothetical protein GDO78_002365 [Eleutherodactylus coqui]|uniref:WKF domain-containing protein n=1 Tax=Eleutherodactylus coqui TaxID=57060 RepID=A0A8J6K2I3_ELECQ|nr:hypothetical protein GDO78_002365 [Eleutherodactylus coqui]
MAQNKEKSEKRGKKQPAEDASQAPAAKKKKRTTAVSEESVSEKTQVEPQDSTDTEDLTPEERRVLERKLKKERKKEEKRLKREKESLTGKPKEEPPKPVAGKLALKYLKSWSKKKPEWKFQKTRQTWLLSNMFDQEKVSDKHFKRLLKYLVDLKGTARETTIQKAEQYMKEYDNQETHEDSDEQRITRVREVLQLLS